MADFWDNLLKLGSGLLGGVLGGASGSNANNASTSSTSAPWKVQQPYLLAGFQNAAQNLKNNQENPYYTGDLYAGLNDIQKGAISGTTSFANGTGANATNSILNAATGNLGGNSTGAFNAASGLYNMASIDPTQSNIASAGAYANNPYLSGMIDAASRDVTRNLSENVLPGINRTGAATGNTNSSRTGIAEGIALRGAQDRIGDIASEMRGNAYNGGLTLAENARQNNMAGLNSAANAFGSNLQTGIQGAATGLQSGYNNFDAVSKAGGLLQQDQQGIDNAALQAYLNKHTQPSQWLNDYMTAIKGNYGGTTSNTANNGQPNWLNTLQGGLGGVSTGLGLYKDFSNLFSQK